jgi:hypothetical protein
MVGEIETELVKGTGGKIAGFANDAGNIIPHGLEQMLTRSGVGVSNKAVIDAVNNGLKMIQPDGRIMFIGNDATVIREAYGMLVTAWARSSAGYR